MVTSAKKNKKEKKKKHADTATEMTETIKSEKTAADNDNDIDHKNGDSTLENNDNGIVNEPNVSTSRKSKKKNKKDFDFDFEDDSGDEKVQEKPVQKPDSAAKKLEAVPDESGVVVKTAAQKRAEKKERDKKKKEAEKAKVKAKAKKDETKEDTKVDDKTEDANIETESGLVVKEGEEGAASNLSGTCTILFPEYLLPLFRGETGNKDLWGK